MNTLVVVVSDHGEEFHDHVALERMLADQHRRGLQVDSLVLDAHHAHPERAFPADRQLHDREGQEPQPRRHRQNIRACADIALEQGREDGQKGTKELAQDIGEAQQDQTGTHPLLPCG